MELNNLMGTDKFKVFEDLHEVFEEIREYHRKSMPSGMSQIVKLKEDLIDAIRGAYMMARFAEQQGMLDNAEDVYVEDYKPTNAMGY